MRNTKFTCEKYGHGKYKVLDRMLMDYLGEYVTLSEAKRVVTLQNLKLAVLEIELFPLLIANMLPSGRLTVDAVTDVMAEVIEYADVPNLRMMIKDTEFLKECISTIIYQ